MTQQQRFLLIFAAVGVTAAAGGMGYFWGIHAARRSSHETSTVAPAPPSASVENHVITPGEGLELSATDLERHSQAALTGDGEAAFRVYLHYNFAMGNADEAARWALFAAENGNWEGMSIVGHRLIRSKRVHDCHRAHFWIRKMREQMLLQSENERLGRAIENLADQYKVACQAH